MKAKEKKSHLTMLECLQDNFSSHLHNYCLIFFLSSYSWQWQWRRQPISLSHKPHNFSSIQVYRLSADENEMYSMNFVKQCDFLELENPHFRVMSQWIEFQKRKIRIPFRPHFHESRSIAISLKLILFTSNQLLFITFITLTMKSQALQNLFSGDNIQ